MTRQHVEIKGTASITVYVSHSDYIHFMSLTRRSRAKLVLMPTMHIENCGGTSELPATNDVH
ncbi:hypothetical protein BDZ89DRAFT_1057546 [Hymenopellis radicata]|nr:hypothetical protein BDZ89DRAFT_1057546 [Hymenopellis radicata]